jgi:ADP-ribosyl-[dinitrogen reductase] hydrolase
MDARQDRIRGVLIGQAAGDALGVHYELGTPSHGKAQMLGGGYGFEPYEWSDDTQQAIVIAQAAGDVPLAGYVARVGVGLLRWYRSGPADVGPTAGRVLGRIKDHDNVLRMYPDRVRTHLEMAAQQNYENRGRAMGSMSNGSLMRTNPAILPFLGRRQQGARVVREISNLTHADPMAGDAAVLWSLAVEHAIEAGTGFDPVRHMGDGVHYLDERQHQWAQLIGEAIGSDPHKFRGNLAVVPAFQAALSTVAHAESYEHGVQLAIDIGGDTDTIAAIAGGLLGAIYGASEVPGEWRSKLHGWPGLTGFELEHLALDAAGELYPKVAE